MQKILEIYCDGSSKNNGKEESEGGYGICVLEPSETRECGYILRWTEGIHTKGVTNNRNELSALLKALELSQTEYKDYQCIIYSDSSYCVNIFNEWIWNWAHRNWIRSGNQPIENLDLIKQLWEYWKIEWGNFQVKKIPGHAGILGNEIADAIASRNMAKLDKIFEKNDIILTLKDKLDLF